MHWIPSMPLTENQRKADAECFKKCQNFTKEPSDDCKVYWYDVRENKEDCHVSMQHFQYVFHYNSPLAVSCSGKFCILYLDNGCHYIINN